MTKLYEQGFPFFSAFPLVFPYSDTTVDDEPQGPLGFAHQGNLVYKISVTGNDLYFAESGVTCTRNDTLIPAGTSLYVRTGRSSAVTRADGSVLIGVLYHFMTAEDGKNGTIRILEFKDD